MYCDPRTGEQEISAVSGRVGMYGMTYLHKINVNSQGKQRSIQLAVHVTYVRFNTWYEI